MIRKLKTMGMALVAVLALSAAVASVASSEGIYTAPIYPFVVDGVGPAGNNTIGTEAGNVECLEKYEATLTESSGKVTFNATKTECKAFGFVGATVSMGSCDYVYTTPTTVTAPHVWTAKVDTQCTNPANPIRITAGSCEITIGEQSPGGHAIITTTTLAGGKRDLDAQRTLTEITYTVTKDGFLCPFAGTGHKTGASDIQHAETTIVSRNPNFNGLDIKHP